jgi:hypothetical protein
MSKWRTTMRKKEAIDQLSRLRRRMVPAAASRVEWPCWYWTAAESMPVNLLSEKIRESDQQQLEEKVQQ